MLGYRSIFRAHDRPGRVLDQSVAEFRHWLRTKPGERYDDEPLEFGRAVRFSTDAHALLVREDVAGGTTSLRARLSEVNEAGSWVTTMTVHTEPGRDPLVWIDVNGPERTPDGAEQWTGTPNLARALLGIADACDGVGELNGRPRAVGAGDVDHLLEVVRDGERRGLAFLFPVPDDAEPGSWPEQASDLLRHTLGLSASYLLDAAALAAFNDAVSPRHQVAPGSLRSFASGGRTDEQDDAQRHRTHRLTALVTDEDLRETRHMLGWQARKVAIRRELPPALTELNTRLEKLVDDAVLGRAITWVPSPRTAEAVPDDEALRTRLDDLGAEITAAQAERDEVLVDLQNEQDDHQDTQDELAVLAAENLRLKLLLAGTVHRDEAWDEEHVDAPFRPSSFVELLEHLPDLSYVEFTGDRGPTLELDNHGTTGRWAGKAWDALRALEDYALAKQNGFSGSVSLYLRDTPPGLRGFSAERHTAMESETVKNNRKLSGVRTFEVSPNVTPTGRIEMLAHFKITKRGRVAPRLHYHDATAVDGKVYVGYLGRHLPIDV